MAAFYIALAWFDLLGYLYFKLCGYRRNIHESQKFPMINRVYAVRMRKNVRFICAKGVNAIASAMIYNTAFRTIKFTPPVFKMADSKTYLNVPYAQKDEAKALGARWDPANKKWYVPANKNITLFAKWQTNSMLVESQTTSPVKANARNPAIKPNSSAHDDAPCLITHPTIKDFIAYNGDEPPWD